MNMPQSGPTPRGFDGFLQIERWAW